MISTALDLTLLIIEYFKKYIISSIIEFKNKNEKTNK